MDGGCFALLPRPSAMPRKVATVMLTQRYRTIAVSLNADEAQKWKIIGRWWPSHATRHAEVSWLQRRRHCEISRQHWQSDLLLGRSLHQGAKDRERIGADQRGKFCIKAATSMNRYHNKSDATKEVMDSEGFSIQAMSAK